MYQERQEKIASLNGAINELQDIIYSTTNIDVCISIERAVDRLNEAIHTLQSIRDKEEE